MCRVGRLAHLHLHLLKPRQRGAELLEQPDASAEQDGRHVYAELVHQSGREVLLDRPGSPPMCTRLFPASGGGAT